MLTIRQFFGGKSVWIVTVLAFLPALFGFIYWFDDADNPPAWFLSENIYRPLVIATLLPIMVLILATGALGNEIEDATLPYLTLKPIGRLRIVVEKLLATLVVCIPIILAGLLATYAVVFRGDAGDSESLTFLWALLASAVAGILAYSAVFLLVSLFVARALLVGIVYALVGPSRMYLGHHWLTDVTASYLLGTSYVLGLTALYRRVKVRSLARPNPDAPTA